MATDCLLPETPYRSELKTWIKVKNPKAPAATRAIDGRGWHYRLRPGLLVHEIVVGGEIALGTLRATAPALADAVISAGIYEARARQ